MRVHITVIHNMTGPARSSQADTAKIAHGIGWHEIGLYHYPADTDSDAKLSARIDGVISSVGKEDIVVFQYPSWNGRRYDNELVSHLKIYGKKLIIFVHDLTSLLWENMGPNGENLIREVDLLNRADMLILASSKLHSFLKEYGLKEDVPVVYQKIWELPTEMVITQHLPIKRMLFTGGDDISSYKGKNPIYQFSYENKAGTNENIKWCGFLDMNSLLLEMAKGGFGLVWTDIEQLERYDSMNQSYKIAGYLAAGLPIFIRKGHIHDDFIIENRIGFVISSLEEADKILENLSEKEIQKKYDNVREIQALITKGYYTMRTLNDAVIKAMDLSD